MKSLDLLVEAFAQPAQYTGTRRDPVVVNYIREFETSAGVPRDHVCDVTMYVWLDSWWQASFATTSSSLWPTIGL
jgi:hypothetical protein